MSVYDEGYAESRREESDLCLGVPGYETEPPDDDREPEDDEA